MEVVALIRTARKAGLTITAEGDTLVVRGPKSAAPVVRQLADVKAEVLAALVRDEQLRGAAKPLTVTWCDRFAARTVHWSLNGRRSWQEGERLAFGEMVLDWHRLHGAHPEGADIIESAACIDVRQLRREGLLRSGVVSTCRWTSGLGPSREITVRIQGGLMVLNFQARLARSREWETVEQTVPIVWTRCHLGGCRPWFSCAADVAGEPCGRRVAKLYLHNQLVFACRTCSGLIYRSQQLGPSDRAQWRAQKLRKRLGGSRNVPLPEKPPRMHWSTYHRLLGKVITAQECSAGLSTDRIWRRFPGLL
jgi:hypothetical protein